ncbi:MAG: NAD-dependent epimerase/dehydratase family protein [Rhizobiaceae bacterium]
MAETILLTGAAGLIGRALHRRLTERGNSVIAMDRIGSDDIAACDLTEVHRLYELADKATAVLHCGAISGPMVARDNPHLIVQSNIVGTANIFELARVKKMRRVVFLSSVSAYGSTPEGVEPVPENVTLHPSSVYGASKMAGEALAEGYLRQHGVDIVSIRPAWVYGPGRTTACAIREMIEDAQAGRPTHFPYGRDFYKQYVHVEDVAEAILAALDAKSFGQRAYTISGDTYYTFEEVAAFVRKALPSARISIDPGADPMDDLQARFDLSAAARDLGYKPKIGLEEGIRSYAEWLAGRNAR